MFLFVVTHLDSGVEFHPLFWFVLTCFDTHHCSYRQVLMLDMHRVQYLFVLTSLDTGDASCCVFVCLDKF